MDNIIAERIKNVKLTKSQEKIADYCIRNIEWVGMKSSMEVARAIGVSDVSMTRFARAIGYSGYTELKNAIYNSMANRSGNGEDTLSLLERADLSRQKYGDYISAEDYLSMIRSNMERTLKNNSTASIEKAVNMLYEAEHRFVIGFRGCFGICAQCAWLMRFVTEHVITINDEGPDCIGRLEDAGSGDCILIFSLSRFYRIELKLTELAHRLGAKICLITNSAVSPLAAYADVVLTVETETASFFNSAMSVNMLSEYLITGLYLRCEDSYKKRVAMRDNITEYLRL